MLNTRWDLPRDLLEKLDNYTVQIFQEVETLLTTKNWTDKEYMSFCEKNLLKIAENEQNIKNWDKDQIQEFAKEIFLVEYERRLKVQCKNVAKNTIDDSLSLLKNAETIIDDLFILPNGKRGTFLSGIFYFMSDDGYIEETPKISPHTKLLLVESYKDYIENNKLKDKMFNFLLNKVKNTLDENEIDEKKNKNKKPVKEIDVVNKFIYVFYHQLLFQENTEKNVLEHEKEEYLKKRLSYLRDNFEIQELKKFFNVSQSLAEDEIKIIQHSVKANGEYLPFIKQYFKEVCDIYDTYNLHAKPSVKEIIQKFLIKFTDIPNQKEKDTFFKYWFNIDEKEKCFKFTLNENGKEGLLEINTPLVYIWQKTPAAIMSFSRKLNEKIPKKYFSSLHMTETQSRDFISWKLDPTQSVLSNEDVKDMLIEALSANMIDVDLVESDFNQTLIKTIREKELFNQLSEHKNNSRIDNPKKKKI